MKSVLFLFAASAQAVQQSPAPILFPYGNSLLKHIAYFIYRKDPKTSTNKLLVYYETMVYKDPQTHDKEYKYEIDCIPELITNFIKKCQSAGCEGKAYYLLPFRRPITDNARAALAGEGVTLVELSYLPLDLPLGYEAITAMRVVRMIYPESCCARVSRVTFSYLLCAPFIILKAILYCVMILILFLIFYLVDIEVKIGLDLLSLILLPIIKKWVKAEWQRMLPTLGKANYNDKPTNAPRAVIDISNQSNCQRYIRAALLPFRLLVTLVSYSLIIALVLVLVPFALVNAVLTGIFWCIGANMMTEPFFVWLPSFSILNPNTGFI